MAYSSSCDSMKTQYKDSWNSPARISSDWLVKKCIQFWNYASGQSLRVSANLTNDLGWGCLYDLARKLLPTQMLAREGKFSFNLGLIVSKSWHTLNTWRIVQIPPPLRGTPLTSFSSIDFFDFVSPWQWLLLKFLSKFCIKCFIRSLYQIGQTRGLPYSAIHFRCPWI